MTERFADRLMPDAFRRDEPWGIGLVRAGRAVDWAITVPDDHADIPEGIAERLLALGRAYRLHELSALDGAGQHRLNGQQAATLADEVEFLMRVIDNSALREYVRPLLEFARRCGRSRDTELILEAREAI
jgi:hypothetical protein